MSPLKTGAIEPNANILSKKLLKNLSDFFINNVTVDFINPLILGDKVILRASWASFAPNCNFKG